MGDVAARFKVEQRTLPGFGRHAGHEFDDVMAKHQVLHDVPITTPGGSVPLVGIVGPGSEPIRSSDGW